MPITVRVPAGAELYDSERNEFIFKTDKDLLITLEHSLVSLQKWEQKWHVPFFDENKSKTLEQVLDYLHCMTLSKNVPDHAYRLIPRSEMKRIEEYIKNPMTATTIKRDGGARDREIKTAEVLYCDMIMLGIPFECRKWHLNSLITLIATCHEKQKAPKKMARSEIYAQNRELNRLRRAALNSKG